jgi:ABC-type spermidine/putrescine transport system permease subunit II
MFARRTRSPLLWVLTVLALLFLYLPLVPPLLLSLSPSGRIGSGEAFTVRWYQEMWNNPILVDSVTTSVVTALLVGSVTPVLAVLAAMAVREFRVRRLIVLLLVLPLFVPGVSMGLATAFFFRQLGIDPSLLTIAIVHIVWALPFAFLIVLASMATFDPVYLESAYLLGAGRWRAFRDVELPLIFPGVSGAAIFSMIISFNETIRTTMVQGGLNTVQTYIWSTFRQVGLSPVLFALMGSLILLTFGLVVALIVLGGRDALRNTYSSSRITSS